MAIVESALKMMELQEDHDQLVAELKKSGNLILEEQTGFTCNLNHMILALMIECGELGEIIKPYLVYKRDIAELVDDDKVRAKIIKEMGDIEFYLNGLRRALVITRENVLQENINKLRKRHPDGFTDTSALAKVDEKE